MITAGEFFAAKERKQNPAKAAWHHSVYVIELDPKVLKDRKFRAANPGHDPAKPCLYIGATGMSPQMRFVNHKRGYKSNRYAKKFGLHLRPDLFEFYNPMPYKAAIALEVELAMGLREDGYAVWQA
jgi:hypothetical protein